MAVLLVRARVLSVERMAALAGGHNCRPVRELDGAALSFFKLGAAGRPKLGSAQP
jgi:hypothetical protein